MGEVKVLVTGVGGPLGVSIIRALKMSRLDLNICGTDADPLSAGFFIADTSRVLPDARGDKDVYLEELVALCRRWGTSIVFPGSEAELRVLAENRAYVENQTGAFLMVNDAELVNMALDKWKTVQFLQGQGIPAPASALPEEREQVELLIESKGFPLILKPRCSSGSKGVFLVEDKKELAAAATLVKEAVLQEYLPSPEEEYTVGVFSEEPGRCSGTIIFRRCLGGGLTYKAVVTRNKEIEKISIQTAEVLKAIGPFNLQLRLTDRGPVIFEINPRLSSSTVMRAHFGFNEPEMAVRKYVLGEELAPLSIKEGTALRFWEELYL